MERTSTESRMKKRGVLDAAERILGHFIDRPGVKNAAKRLVNDLDPESSRALMRTALWRDPDLLFTAVGAVPKVVNSLITAADELLVQVESKLTPTMRSELTRALLDDIDWETLERVLDRGRSLRRELSPLFEHRETHKLGEDR